MDRFRLDGRVALVTGGARGLGRVMVEALAEAGASVALTARDQDRATKAAAEVSANTGAKTLGISADVALAADIAKMVAATLDGFGRLDILVNNAGINIRHPIEQFPPEEWDQILHTNLTAPWLCCRAVAEPMKRQKWGRIINVSSILGELGMADRTAYCASKGGLTVMTRALALEWAQHGINVNALCPGPFATEINLPLMKDPAVRAAFEQKVPLKRWGEPIELGPAAVFLASEASSFMTGATLFIDGGFTAQ
jgi:NAD(P)-dependent dehydrogenase (short-subunit alcohol dehydrogenase family)